jgi:serine/threonine protein kinase
MMRRLNVTLLALPMRANFNKGLGRRELGVPLQVYLHAQLVDCLSHLHKGCGLSHLDLKLENIMINMQMGLTLIDFD